MQQRDRLHYTTARLAVCCKSLRHSKANQVVIVPQHCESNSRAQRREGPSLADNPQLDRHSTKEGAEGLQ